MGILFFFLLSFFAFASASHYESKRYCLETAPRSRCSGCTANDVSFAEVRLAGAPRSCTIGERVNLTVNALWDGGTAAERYQVAVYIAMDGGNARTGTCYPYYLHEVSTSANNLASIGEPTSETNFGPFPDLDGDGCGDINAGQPIWQSITLDFICRDTSNDGTADFNYCMGWENNKNDAGCFNISTASCSAKPKCTCANIDIKGLTVCASQQLACLGDDGEKNTLPCEPVWSAKVKISASVNSKVFPPLSVLYANAYLDFQSQNQTLGLEYYDQAVEPPFTGAPVREEILFPCKSSAYNFCQGQCTAIFSRNFLPRIFHEGSYMVDSFNGKINPDVEVPLAECPSLDASINVTGLRCFRKTISTVPAPGEAIEWIWAHRRLNSRWEVAIARSLDGTVWEMFIEDATTRGTLLASPGTPTAPSIVPVWQDPVQLPTTDPVTLYNAQKYNAAGGSCGGSNPPCSAAVDLVFAVDQKHPTLSGWSTQMQTLILATISNATFSNEFARFGAGFSGGQVNPGIKYAPTAMAKSVAGSIQLYFRDPNLGGPLDYALLITKTLHQYFCNGVASQCAAPGALANSRRLVVIAGGPDTPGSTTWQSVWNLYALLRVEVHVEAFSAGADSSMTPTLLNIVNGFSGRITRWPFIGLLASDSLYLYRRLCPASTSICGQCGGFCSCGAVSYECTCPADCITTDVCNPSTCVTGSLGCQVDPASKIICPKDDACRPSQCQNVGGVATCVASNLNCTIVLGDSLNLCNEPFCDPAGGCGQRTRSVLPAACVRNEPCFRDGCNSDLNGGRGGCTFEAIPYSIQNPQCGVNPCTPGLAYPCAAGSLCAPVACIGSITDCLFVPAANRSACESQFDPLAANSAGFYCSASTKDCSASNDACNTYSCSEAALGACRVSAQTTCTTTDKCLTSSCGVSGCQYDKRDPASVCDPIVCKIPACDQNNCTYTNSTTLACSCQNNPCDPDNNCTTTTCINTPAGCSSADNPGICSTDVGNGERYCSVRNKACSSNTNCSTYACDLSDGICKETPQPCTDNDQCTFDSCATGSCVSTPLTAAQLRSVCPPQSCQIASCANGNCMYTPDNANCGACRTENITAPAATYCFSSTCIDALTPVNCTDVIPSEREACEGNVSSTGYFVGRLALTPGPCPSNDPCNSYTCTEGPDACNRAQTVCTPPNACFIGSCVPSSSGCVYTALTQAEINVKCAPASCRLADCSAGVCTFANDTTSIQCQCETGPSCQLSAPDTFCTQTICINSLTGVGGCASIPAGDKRTACEFSVRNSTTRYCYTAERANVCPASDQCVSYSCVNNAQNPSTGTCMSSFTTCAAPANKCQKSVCNATNGCISIALSPQEESVVCGDGNACTNDKCVVGSGNGTCTNLPLVPLPPSCAQCQVASCPTGTACAPIVCFKDCANPAVRNVTACNASVTNVTGTGVYCETQTIDCSSQDNVCTTFTCDNGSCVGSPRLNCATTNLCRVGICSTAAGGCVESDPCLSGSFASQSCLQPKCELSSNSTNGFVCFGSTAKDRDCADYRCSATGTPSEILVGALAQQFLDQYMNQSATCVPIECTQDSCDSNTAAGCVNQAAVCTVSVNSPCNSSIGCYEPGNIYDYESGVCIEVILQSLFDFCGTCLGDNVACFFTSLDNAAVVGGIAGGVVAAIVIAAIIAALLIAFFSKKGYDYYAAQSALSSTGLQNNPAFQENNNQGKMPGSDTSTF